jgi:hypothetical protein
MTRVLLITGEAAAADGVTYPEKIPLKSGIFFW